MVAPAFSMYLLASIFKWRMLSRVVGFAALGCIVVIVGVVVSGSFQSV